MCEFVSCMEITAREGCPLPQGNVVLWKREGFAGSQFSQLEQREDGTFGVLIFDREWEPVIRYEIGRR